MNTRDALMVETKELLRAITIFKCLKYEQMCKLLHKKEQIADKILKNLFKQHRLFKDKDTDIVAVNEQLAETLDLNIINAFWVFLEFNEKAEYYDIGEYPSIITFFADGEHYEIVYATCENEVIFNYAVSKNDYKAKRLVIIDDCAQIDKLEVPNLLCFCTVSKNGKVEFYKIE